MANIITLNEEITFGKHAGCTGRQLMQNAEGTHYLKWIWNNTDIPMDAHIAHALVSQGLVSRDVERRNSRQGGAVSTIPFSECLDPRMLEGAIRHQMRHDAIQGGAHDSEADTARVWLVKGDDRTLDPRMLEGAIRHQMRHDRMMTKHNINAAYGAYCKPVLDERTENICNNKPYLRSVELTGDRQITAKVVTPIPQHLSKREILSRFRQMLKQESREVDKLVR